MRTIIAVNAAIISIGVLSASPAHADEPLPPPAPVAGQQAPPPATQGAPNDVPDGDGQVGPYWTGDYSEDIYIFL
jgi:hypothetical protein